MYSRCYKLVVSLSLAIWLCGSTAVQFVRAQNIVSPDAKPEKVIDGHQFTEGPYWHEEGYLLFSDIPANTIYKWSLGDKNAQSYLNPSGHSNGIASAPGEGILLAQHEGKISLLRPDKTMRVVAESYDGKRLNSPNDLTAATDGTIYFTDPPFGISEENRELKINGVYKITAQGKVVLLYEELYRPNGIVLSPDQKNLYVNDTSSGRILSFSINEDGSISAPVDFASVGMADDTGSADGMAVDREGNVYSTGPGGIHIFSSDGTLIQKIGLPVKATNLAWGGEKLNILFITTPSGIYQLTTNTVGVRK